MKKILFLFNAKAIKLRQVLLDDFSKEGYECYCALPKDDVAFWSEKYPQIHFVPFNNFSGTSVGIADNLKTYFKIKNLIKQIRPDIVFLGNVKPNIYGGIAAHKCGIKHIYGLVSGLGYAFIDEPGLKRAIVKHICTFLYKLGFKHASHVFIQNPDDRNLFIEKQIVREENSSVVPGTGVDLKLFCSKPFPQQLTFLMAARLIKEKGVFHFVEAAKALKPKYPQVRFVLGGNIDTNPSAITKAQLEECSQFVDYIGYVEDMAEALEKCSVFVYPSYYREGIPRALLEACACGRPVITTDGVGCREAVVDGENGYKIPVKSTECLAEAMEKFIVNPEIIPVMGQKGRALAENKFEIHRVNRQIIGVVESGLK